MNELQIIQQQLAMERQHFAEIADACLVAVGKSIPPGSVPVAEGCLDYFACASQRLNPATRHLVNERLRAIRDARGSATELQWRELIEFLRGEIGHRSAALTARLTGQFPSNEWRADARIDADSILEERAAYSRVKAALSRDLPPLPAPQRA